MITVAFGCLIAGFGIGFIISDMIANAKTRKLIARLRQYEIDNAKLIASIRMLLKLIPKPEKDNHNANPSKF